MERVKPEIHNTVKERIKPLITKAGNVSAFARSIGISRDAVNNWLFDKSDFRLNDLVKISQEYDVSVDYLLGLSDINTTSDDIKAVCAFTGLSPAAVSKVCQTVNLSVFIESPQFENFYQLFLSAIGKTRQLASWLNIGQTIIDEKTALSLTDMSTALAVSRYRLSEAALDLLESVIPAKSTIEQAERMVSSSGFVSTDPPVPVSDPTIGNVRKDVS